MVKDELEYIEVDEELLDQMKEFRGRFFKEFMTLGDDADEDQIFYLFVQRGLETTGIEVVDVYEQLSLPDFAIVLAKVMELNNMEELFRAMERLNRSVPGTYSNE